VRDEKKKDSAFAIKSKWSFVADHNDIGKDIEILQRYINNDYCRHLFFLTERPVARGQ